MESMAEFNRKWYNHIDDLDRLKVNLPEDERRELDQLKRDLKDLVDEAHEHYAAKRHSQR